MGILSVAPEAAATCGQTSPRQPYPQQTRGNEANRQRHTGREGNQDIYDDRRPSTLTSLHYVDIGGHTDGHEAVHDAPRATDTHEGPLDGVLLRPDLEIRQGNTSRQHITWPQRKGCPLTQPPPPQYTRLCYSKPSHPPFPSLVRAPGHPVLLPLTSTKTATLNGGGSVTYVSVQGARGCIQHEEEHLGQGRKHTHSLGTGTYAMHTILAQTPPQPGLCPPFRFPAQAFT